MSIDRAALLPAIDRLTAAMDAAFDRLNAADAALGDGDLGVTMSRGMALVSEAAPTLPEDLGAALLRCAQAFTKSSGSSYGTLLATGLMAMAKATKGRTELDVADLAPLVAAARDAMMARGKAALGGKTVLDSLDAVAGALDGESDPAGRGGGRGQGRARRPRRLPRPAGDGRPRPHLCGEEPGHGRSRDARDGADCRRACRRALVCARVRRGSNTDIIDWKRFRALLELLGDSCWSTDVI